MDQPRGGGRIPPFVGLSLGVHEETRLGLKPFGTLNAVMSTEAGQIFSGLRLLEQLQVSGRREVSLDLVDVPGQQISMMSERFSGR